MTPTANRTSMPVPQTLEQAEGLLAIKRAHLDKIQSLIDQLSNDAVITGRVADSLARLLRQLGDADNDVLQAEFWSMERRRESKVDLSEEDYVLELETAAVEMPEAHLAIVAGVWLERHRMVAVPADTRARKRRKKAGR